MHTGLCHDLPEKECPTRTVGPSVAPARARPRRPLQAALSVGLHGCGIEPRRPGKSVQSPRARLDPSANSPAQDDVSPSARTARRRRWPGKSALPPPQPPCSRMCVDFIDTLAEDRLGYAWKFSLCVKLELATGSISVRAWGPDSDGTDCTQERPPIELEHFGSPCDWFSHLKPSKLIS